MENKTQTKTSATQKTAQNPEVQKLLQELNDKAGKGVSLDELEEFVINAGNKLVEIGADKDENRSVRISSLDNALKTAFDFYGKKKTETIPKVLFLIAEACYERSLLILSRQDKIMLEKKKRIIKKGIEFIEKIASKDKEALRIWCLLLLELEKIDKDALIIKSLF